MGPHRVKLKASPAFQNHSGEGIVLVDETLIFGGSTISDKKKNCPGALFSCFICKAITSREIYLLHENFSDILFVTTTIGIVIATLVKASIAVEILEIIVVATNFNSSPPPSPPPILVTFASPERPDHGCPGNAGPGARGPGPAAHSRPPQQSSRAGACP